MKQIERVLIIDDDETCVFLARLVLKKIGIDKYTQSAKNGLEGLKRLREAEEEGKLPELVLLDIKMPVMDGFSFLEELEKFQDTYTNTRIILLSSSQNLWEVERARNSKAAAFLHKPLTEEKLLSILSQ